MSKKDQALIGRRSLVTGMSAAAGLAVVATSASAQTRSSDFEPTRHSIDAWMGELPGEHRAFIDTSTGMGGADALRYAFNILNAQGSAYGGEDSDFAMIVCYRHASTPFAYNDAMWAKYGETFYGLMQYADPATGVAPKVNLMTAGGPFSMGAITGRGVQIAICAAATQFISGQIAAATGASAEEVFDELVANAVPNSRFVSAGVMAVTRAQEYGYSLLYAG
jgi:hypothetical protein